MNWRDLTAEDIAYFATFGALSGSGYVPSEQAFSDAIEHPVDTAVNTVTGFSTGLIIVLAVGAYFLLKK